MKKRILTILIIIVHIYTLYGQKKEVNFLFAGDAMQHKSQIDAARTKEGFDYSSYFSKIEDKIQKADIAVVNLEVTLAGKPHTGYPMFSAPDEFAVALKDCGFDIFLTANNHALDRHRKGIERTISILDSLKVLHTGTFVSQEKRDIHYPLMMIRNGIRIAMLNYTYDTNGFKPTAPNIVNYIDKDRIRQDINAANAMKADIIIANMHWGYEYKLMHNKEQKELADFLTENGVKIVIGNHPHVVQPIDIRYDENREIEAVIVYSLGNFVSGMKLVNTTGGAVVDLKISKEDENPVKIEDCSYSLVWTHKTTNQKDVFNFFELIPVDDYENEDGEEYLGEKNFELMKSFAAAARKAIETYWN